eukprot:3727951-Rhodomonas_salina.2
MADPYTVHVALDEGGSASGELYIDDGDSMDYAKGPGPNSIFSSFPFLRAAQDGFAAARIEDGDSGRG